MDASVNFKVNGGELSNYLDQVRQKTKRLSDDFLSNASKESQASTDQLSAYNRQVAALERKVRLEENFARAAARDNKAYQEAFNRNSISARMQEVDNRFGAGIISPRERSREISRLDREEIANQADIEARFTEAMSEIAEQSRESQLIVAGLREIRDEIAESSAEQIGEMRRGDERLINSVESTGDNPQEVLANRLASEQYVEERDKKNKEEESNKEGVGKRVSDILSALAFERIGGMIAQMPQSQNELEYAKPMMSMMGMVSGGALGAIAEAFTAGQIELLGFGAQIGEKVGELLGGATERSFKSREALTVSNYRLQGLIGTDMGVNAFGANGLGGTGIARNSRDLSGYGIDYNEAASMQYSIAQSQGNGRNLGRNVEDMAALKQALALDEGVYLGITEILRSSKDNKDVMNVVGQALSSGLFQDGDRTFLGELLTKNFSSLQRTFLQTQNDVDTATTLSVISQFDRIGGQFAARDPRSSGLLQNMHSSLVNPGSDNLKALSMMTLHGSNPEMSITELLEEQQKGLSSSTYRQGMLEMIKRIGGDKDMQIMNIAGMFNLGGNISAARSLYDNMDSIIAGKDLDFSNANTEGWRENVRATGQAQTGKYTSSTAEFENAFIRGPLEGLEKVGEKMGELFGDMADEIKKYVKEQWDQSMSSGASENVVRKGGMSSKAVKAINNKIKEQ